MLFFITYSFIDNYTDTKMRGPMLIINPRSWKLPCNIMIQLSTPLRYNYPISIGYNTPKDVNVIALLSVA